MFYRGSIPLPPTIILNWNRMKKELVKCKDCANGRKPKDIVVRCMKLGVGKVANAYRYCDMFYPKEISKNKNT